LQPGVYTAQTFPQELSHYFLLSSPRYDSLFINLITVVILFIIFINLYFEAADDLYLSEPKEECSGKQRRRSTG